MFLNTRVLTFLHIFCACFPRVFMFLKVKGALQKHRPCRKTTFESDPKMTRFLDDSGDCRFCLFALLQRGKSILMILGNLCPRCPFPSPWRGICNYVYFVFLGCVFLKNSEKTVFALKNQMLKTTQNASDWKKQHWIIVWEQLNKM